MPDPTATQRAEHGDGTGCTFRSPCNLNVFQHWKIYNLLPSGSYEKGHCALGLSLKQTGAIFQKIPKTLRVDAICNHSKCYVFAVQEAPGVFRVGEIAVRDKNLFASILRQVDEQIGSGHVLFLRNARRGDACMRKTGNTQWKPDSALWSFGFSNHLAWSA
jgi:hypothetical protein